MMPSKHANDSAISTAPFTINGRTYHPPGRPVAVICIDGCADEYLSTSLAHGRMGNLQRMLAAGGYRGLVRGALPSFTNVNNASIATGLPPSVHGISGNFFLDPETGEEVMMNSAAYLRAETILAAAAQDRPKGGHGNRQGKAPGYARPQPRRHCLSPPRKRIRQQKKRTASRMSKSW